MAPINIFIFKGYFLNIFVFKLERLNDFLWLGVQLVDLLMVQNGTKTYQLKNTSFKEDQKVYNRTQLKEDFRQLQNILNRLHPSLHGPISQHEFNQLCYLAHEA